jgi:hypothetical protein
MGGGGGFGGGNGGGGFGGNTGGGGGFGGNGPFPVAVEAAIEEAVIEKAVVDMPIAHAPIGGNSGSYSPAVAAPSAPAAGSYTAPGSFVEGDFFDDFFDGVGSGSGSGTGAALLMSATSESSVTHSQPASTANYVRILGAATVVSGVGILAAALAVINRSQAAATPAPSTAELM